MIRYYVYQAVLVGSPDTTLRVEGGTITLDSTRAPHVQADIRVTRPGPATLSRLDPRRSPAPRIRVVVSESGGAGRTFDLTVRDLDSTQGSDQLTITAHSDEALAADYSPLTTIDGLWGLTHEGVRGVVDYVLHQVPGVRKNYARFKPLIGAGADGWGHYPESGPSSSAWGGLPGSGGAWTANPDSPRINSSVLPLSRMSSYYVTFTTVPTGGFVTLRTGFFPVPAGEITGSLYGADSITGSSWNLKFLWANAAGTFIGETNGPTAGPTSVNYRWQVTGTRPTGATQAVLQLTLRSGTIEVGDAAWITGAMVEDGPTMGPYVTDVLTASTVNASVDCSWPLTNLIVNPSFELGTEGWEIHSGVSDFRTIANTVMPNPQGNRLEGTNCARWTASAASAYIKTKPMTVTPGRWYEFLATVSASSTLASVHTIMRFLDAGGNVLRNRSGSYGTYGEWSTVQVKGQAPEGAASVIMFVGITGASVGMMGYLECVILAEDVENDSPRAQRFPYFSGATPADTKYMYAWSGDPHISNSTRTPINERPAGVLVWEPGTSALDFLGSLLQAVGLRLVCDANRIWTLRNEGYQAPGTITIRYGVNMVAGRDVLERSEWYDAAVARYRWRNAYGEEQIRDDRFGSPNATRTRLFEREAVWPGRGFAEYAVRRAKQRGRLVTVTAVTDFKAVAEQGVSIALEALTPQIGIAERVEFSLDRDEMTITTRTTDTLTGSIDALTGTINALTGTINNL